MLQKHIAVVAVRQQRIHQVLREASAAARAAAPPVRVVTAKRGCQSILLLLMDHTPKRLSRVTRITLARQAQPVQAAANQVARQVQQIIFSHSPKVPQKRAAALNSFFFK